MHLPHMDKRAFRIPHPRPMNRRCLSASDEPQVSVPKPKPGPELKPVGPDSLGQAVDPESPPAGARRQVPSWPEPEMTYRPRWGFLLAGVLTMAPGLFLGAIALDVSYNRPFICDDCGPLPATATLLVFGGIEAVAVTFLIVGLVGHDVPVVPPPQGRDLAFLPFVTPQAEGLSMLMRW